MFSGGIGLVIAAMVYLFVPEPERKVQEPIEEDNDDDSSCSLSSAIDEEKNFLTCFSDLLKRPITKWMTVSASLQQAIIMICDYFYPLYFLSRFP